MGVILYKYAAEGVEVFEEGKLISIEDVTGNENGITQVKAIIEFIENGDLKNSSKYLMNDKWVDGHMIYYKEAPQEKIIFKCI